MKIKYLNSIQTRLSLISLGMMAFVLILLSFLSIYKDYRSYTAQIKTSLTRTASLVGDNSLASLLFDDPDSAKEILGSLDSQEHLISAGLLTNKNRMFSQYFRNNNADLFKNGLPLKIISQIKHTQINSFREHGHYAVLVKSIIYEKKLAGKIYLIYDMIEREYKLIDTVYMMLIVFAISLALMFVMSYFFQRSIIKPIRRLANTMHDVATTKNFNVTIDASKKQDEIGWLLKGFDEMLGQLRIKDTNLNKINKDLEHLAYHDALTSLPNFLLFKEVVTHAINNRKVSKFCILFIDLDNFKTINDAYGHNIGDAFLKQVSEKFNELLRVGDYASIKHVADNERSVARIGGDEFIIMLDDMGEKHNIDKIIRRIFKDFENPLYIDGNNLFVKLSIGVSIYPDDATDLNKLIKYADTAMYQVKGSGKNNYSYFNKAHHSEVKRKLLIEQEMLTALDKNQFKLFYQAKIDLKTNQVSGFEVLLRWVHPELGFISPGEFIPIAEMCHFIIPLGEWVINQACKQLRIWRDEMPLQFNLAINLSPVQFKSDSLFDLIKTALMKNNLEAGSIELEITEGILMDDHEFSFKAIDKLRQLGLIFSIDDFGTGYSSFQYLSKFNAEVIKIDKIFIDDIDHFEENQIISNSIISLAHNMGMKVVAEGVETIEQVNYLKAQNCDIIQGYYFCKPLPEEDVVAFLKPYQQAK